MEPTPVRTGETLLCPGCLAEVQGDRRCPVCGAVLDKGDWPVITGVDGLAPWSAANLLPPAEGGRQYRLPPLTDAGAKGTLRTALPYAFKEGKKVIRLGGSQLEADVLVEGASPLAAVLLLNRRTRTWWLYDCGSASGVQVNGERVHCRELQLDDLIALAGVVLAFRGDRLESGRASARGMSLSVEDLCFSIPDGSGGRRHILDHVTFSIAPGEFIGVLGPSGCGKSSLVQRLIGLSDEFTGEIFVNGNPRDENPRGFRAATAYLPQNVDETLHENLRLSEEIDCFRRIHLVPSDDEERENLDCLGTLGLSAKAESRIGDLSGGEKRRVGIALALLRRPQLLLLDEPGAGLDPSSEGVLMRHLRGIADQGRTVLCVTHVLANAEKFDKLLVLSAGRIVYFGKPSELLRTFEVKDFGALYLQLERGLAPSFYRPPAPDRTRSAFPEVEMPTFWRRAAGYFRRTMKEFFRIRRQPAGFRGVLARLFSAPGVFFLWQPLGLVAGIRLACACYFRTVGGQAVDVELLGFCASLAMFWVGINNSARELVKERVPGRCLENLNQVPFQPYLVAKFLWTVAVCAVQTLGFTLMLCLAARIPVPLATAVDSPSLDMPLLWFGPLYVSCLMGAFCGLAVSSIARKQLGAISVVPNIAILALLFSNAMVRFENNNDYYAPVAKTLATGIMPCYWPSKTLDAMQERIDDVRSLICMLSLAAVYISVSAVLVWIFQRRNEKAWDGR